MNARFEEDEDLAKAWAEAAANAQKHSQNAALKRQQRDLQRRHQLGLTNATNYRNAPEPRFAMGNQCGDWYVNSWHSWGLVHPGTGHVYTKDQHWYECTCSCGKREIRSQQQLRDKRRMNCPH